MISNPSTGRRCLNCDRITFNQNDIENHYCAYCHTYTLASPNAPFPETNEEDEEPVIAPAIRLDVVRVNEPIVRLRDECHFRVASIDEGKQTFFAKSIGEFALFPDWSGPIRQLIDGVTFKSLLVSCRDCGKLFDPDEIVGYRCADCSSAAEVMRKVKDEDLLAKYEEFRREAELNDYWADFDNENKKRNWVNKTSGIYYGHDEEPTP